MCYSGKALATLTTSARLGRHSALPTERTVATVATVAGAIALTQFEEGDGGVYSKHIVKL